MGNQNLFRKSAFFQIIAGVSFILSIQTGVKYSNGKESLTTFLIILAIAVFSQIYSLKLKEKHPDISTHVASTIEKT